jgi:hypothetical protein
MLGLNKQILFKENLYAECFIGLGLTLPYAC